MTKKDITQLSFEIIGAAIKINKTVGPGLLESVYERCLIYELELKGFTIKKQINVPIFYDDLFLETNLKLDLLVNDCIIVELKTVERLLPIHEAQLLTYMKLLQVPQGLLINFFTENITQSMKPFVNEYFHRLPK